MTDNAETRVSKPRVVERVKPAPELDADGAVRIVWLSYRLAGRRLLELSTPAAAVVAPLAIALVLLLHVVPGRNMRIINGHLQPFEFTWDVLTLGFTAAAGAFVGWVVVLAATC